MKRSQRVMVGGLALLLTGLLTGAGGTLAPTVTPDDPSLSIDEVLTQAYAGVSPDQVPTGILLERGAINGHGIVLQSDGGKGAEPLSPVAFQTAYMDLRRGSLGVDLPSLEMLNATARPWREDAHATPISLAIIEYTTLINGPVPKYDGKRLDLPRGTLGETGTFVGSYAVVNMVHHWAPTFVVPSDLLLLNGVNPSAITGLFVQIGTAPAQAITLNVPFQPEAMPPAPGPLSFSVEVHVDGAVLTTVGTVDYVGPDGGPMAPQPDGPPKPPPGGPRSNPALAADDGWWIVKGVDGNEVLQYWDLGDPVTGDPFVAPWDEPFQTSDNGNLNIRIIPADPNSSVTAGDDGTYIFELINPVVLVDGFDVMNIRTQNDILLDFGSTIKKLLDLGFDVISVDYQNGRDWIERNGRAFRKLMVTDIVNLVEENALKKQGVAVIAGSMGTQVARWGLVEAENSGEDHHAGLFVNIDGPFAGATIPIGFQAAAVDLTSQAPVAAFFKASLESPASSQMLMRTFPRGAPLQTVIGTIAGISIYGGITPGWYMPRAEFTSYYAAVLGSLPQETRNVAGANGSGTGSLQTNLGDDMRLLGVFGVTGNGFGGGNFSVVVRADGPGARVYEREINKYFLGFLISSSKVWWDLEDGMSLDVSPGGFRTTTHDFINGIGPTINVDGNILDVYAGFDHDQHSFVQTTSAFGLSEVWDNQVSQKCNTEHGSPAPALESMVLSEVTGFRDGVIPPPAAAFSAACEVPEPVENCSPGVIWYADPENPIYVQPFDGGGNCFVRSAPSGAEAMTVDDQYFVVPNVETCFDGGQPQGFDCPYTTVTASDVIGASIPSPGILHIEVVDEGGGGGGPAHCPTKTTFDKILAEPSGAGNDIVQCFIQPPVGVPLGDLYLSGLTIAVAADVSCSAGIPQSIGGQALCYLGDAPVGTSGFDYANNFYYNGWD